MKGFKWLLVLLIGMVSFTSFGETANDTETKNAITIDADVGGLEFVSVSTDIFTDVAENDVGTNEYVYFIPIQPISTELTFSTVSGADERNCYKPDDLQFSYIINAVTKEDYLIYRRARDGLKQS